MDAATADTPLFSGPVNWATTSGGSGTTKASITMGSSSLRTPAQPRCSATSDIASGTADPASIRSSPWERPKVYSSSETASSAKARRAVGGVGSAATVCLRCQKSHRLVPRRIGP